MHPVSLMFSRKDNCLKSLLNHLKSLQGPCVVFWCTVVLEPLQDCHGYRLPGRYLSFNFGGQGTWQALVGNGESCIDLGLYICNITPWKRLEHPALSQPGQDTTLAVKMWSACGLLRRHLTRHRANAIRNLVFLITLFFSLRNTRLISNTALAIQSCCIANESYSVSLRNHD